MSAYYNENGDAAAWLRDLIKRGAIADGEVDDRSIVDVHPEDLRGFRQVHFFAGIGGWSHALRLAGWGDDRFVWTGSCPCQPFSSAAAGKNARTQDKRHLWPEMLRLVAECRPRVLFGEQVAEAGDWFDGVCDDMEALGYEVGAAVLPACSVGQDHVRHRLYFVCDTDSHSEPSGAEHAQARRMPRHRSYTGNVASADGVPSRVASLMRGYGNAIVPPVAREFIGAYMDVSA